MNSQFINTIKSTQHLIIPPIGCRLHLRPHIKPFNSAKQITIINWSEFDIYINLTPFYFPNATRINLLYDKDNKPSDTDAFRLMLLSSSYQRNLEFGIMKRYTHMYTPYIGSLILPISYIDKRILLYGYDYNTNKEMWHNYINSCSFNKLE